MIIGNETILYIDGATYIREAELGELKSICVEQVLKTLGVFKKMEILDINKIYIAVDDAMSDWIGSKREKMYQSVKDEIPL